MPHGRERLHELVAQPAGLAVAPIFDPLSARIAEIGGWPICKLSGSVAKFSQLGVPDGIDLANMTDLADLVLRITQMVDIPLIVDADDGGTALQLRRTIRQLESSGAAAIELEDNVVPSRFIGAASSTSYFMDGRHTLMLSKDQHTRKLEAAVALRRDPSMMIIGRTTGLFLLPLDEALDRVESYARTGVDALMLPGLGREGISPNPKEDIEAVQRVSALPLFVSGLPPALARDTEWLAANRVGLQFLGQLPYRMAVQAIYDALNLLRDGSDGADAAGAPAELQNDIVRMADLREWEQRYATPAELAVSE